jgi:hypothetical protein
MRLFAVATLAFLLAGCGGATPDAADAATDGSIAEAPPGGIAGVVVDDAVRPIARATVELVDSGRTTETDDGGLFVFEDVPAGTHFLKASHPLFSDAQQSVDVVDGEVTPTIRIQLVRVIFAEPYAQLQKFDGFIVCSVGFFIYASEECGEGVGVPCEVPQLGCQRVGGQGNNAAQWDFYLDGPFIATLVVEMAWKPSSETLTEFQLNIGNDWTCDPTCNGNPLNVTGGPSPLYATVDFPRELTTKDGEPIELDANTRFSTFIWPNWGHGDPSQVDVAVNQPFTQYATAFYYLPAPAGWSFLAGDEVPV